MKSRVEQYIQHLIWTSGLVQVNDMLLERTFSDITRSSSNPFNSFGEGLFSQNEEDGLLFEILRRLDTQNNFFVELGVGNGLENNTLALLLSGWSGIWFGGQDLQIETEPTSQLIFRKCWIDLNYINKEIIPEINSKEIEVLSLDLDGNDYHFCKLLLDSGIQPKVWIQEYNSTFSSDVEWIMPYSPNHKWNSTNYFGASFKSFVKLFGQFDYTPIVCNITGSNIFFVKEADRYKFPEVPADVASIYMPSRPWTFRGKRKIDRRILRGIQPS